MDFDVKSIKIDDEGHRIMMKGSIQQEEFMIINAYEPSTRAHVFVEEISYLKREMNSNTIVAGTISPH